MRKRILLGVIAAAVLAAGLFAYLMVNTNTLIARYQPELELTVSDVREIDEDEPIPPGYTIIG